MRPSKKTKNVHPLSVDALKCIFVRLSDPQDLLNCRLVCNLWNDVASHNYVWLPHMYKVHQALPTYEYSLFRHFIRASFWGINAALHTREILNYITSVEGTGALIAVINYLRPTHKIERVEMASDMWRIKVYTKKDYWFAIPYDGPNIVSKYGAHTSISVWISCYQKKIKKLNLNM